MRKAIAVSVALVIAFVLQTQFADRLASPAWRPDFLLAVVLAVSLFAPGKTAACTGFLGGLLEGAACGWWLGGFAVSRVVGAFAASTLADPLNLNVGVAFGIALVGTAVTQVTFLLVEPEPDLVWWLAISLRQTLLTAVLVAALVPISARVLGRGRIDED